jgi:hypothetical protein
MYPEVAHFHTPNDASLQVLVYISKKVARRALRHTCPRGRHSGLSGAFSRSGVLAIHIASGRIQQKTPPPLVPLLFYGRLSSNSSDIVDVFTVRYQATHVLSRDRCRATVLGVTIYKLQDDSRPQLHRPALPHLSHNQQQAPSVFRILMQTARLWTIFQHIMMDLSAAETEKDRITGIIKIVLKLMKRSGRYIS